MGGLIYLAGVGVVGLYVLGLLYLGMKRAAVVEMAAMAEARRIK